eukprot:g21845.t1
MGLWLGSGTGGHGWDSLGLGLGFGTRGRGRDSLGLELGSGTTCDRVGAATGRWLGSGAGLTFTAGTGAEGWSLGPVRRAEAKPRFTVMVSSGAMDWVSPGRAGLVVWGR